MGFPRVTWGMSAGVWFVVLMMCCVQWGLPAATVAIIAGVLPALPLIGGFTGDGRMKPGRVPLYNSMIGMLGPIVVLAIGIVVLFVTGGFATGFWGVGIAGLAWFVHAAASRAFGFGPRLDDGTLPKVEPRF
ncbi:hypothetical protein JOF28_000219 [Leucobacter exalbidus]|uniref:Uncharacterized protein n=1 Tax=Leucobacter exalbidus TaxID=662960 RepID=A0A940PQZ4_9MICO|nr:DUF4260 domain-containing protein [Leucobacter exalbidus]MBP1324987.1 hypothetical protein [Leucobacter exalbidus]